MSVEGAIDIAELGRVSQLIGVGFEMILECLVPSV